jgi:predicted permease
MVLNHLFPVFALIVAGMLMHRSGVTTRSFLNTADRLVYFIFFPILLFWKIGAADIPALWRQGQSSFFLAVLAALAVQYVTSTLFIWVMRVGRFQAGSFSQSCYRFNTYIGMAVVITVMGERGVQLFGVLIGIVIPIINVLAVTTLIWFSDKRQSPTERTRFVAKSLLTNPLILACLAGLSYAALVGSFVPFIDNTLRLAASITLPLALLSIGGALTFRGLRGHLKLSMWAAVFKLVLFPILGWWFLHLFNVSGPAFQVAMIFFALPTATSLYVLSSQLNSDTELASAAIVVSTLLSFFSLSTVLTMAI